MVWRARRVCMSRPSRSPDGGSTGCGLAGRVARLVLLCAVFSQGVSSVWADRVELSLPAIEKASYGWFEATVVNDSPSSVRYRQCATA